MGEEKDKRRRRDEDGCSKSKALRNWDHSSISCFVTCDATRQYKNGARPSKMIASRPARGRSAYSFAILFSLCPSPLSSLLLSSL